MTSEGSTYCPVPSTYVDQSSAMIQDILDNDQPRKMYNYFILSIIIIIVFFFFIYIDN